MGWCNKPTNLQFQSILTRIIFISSRTSTSLLQILEKLNLWRTYSTSGIGLLQDPPFYCKKFCSIDNSIRRLLLLKIVLHSLFADALYGLRPNSAYADPFWLICGGSICVKKTFFSIQDGITLSRKSIPGHKSVLHIKFSLVQRENIKKSKNRMSWYPYKQFHRGGTLP